ncbi:hypothetical protein I6U33_25870 [Pseudomonas carnis]|uniref:hypothetical protein n=1 Tax=Pseudomonas carnis TaxID=2487355 RepID=UPI001C6F71B6|nr:hypothetical protein [Pseudomonas carnis]MBW9240762.1 hypothetical protein [Pseudomonas carnis]
MKFITATQEFTAADREKVLMLSANIKKTAAFDEWRKRMCANDRLPRGPFFKGKKAGPDLFIMDEFWAKNANMPFDLSQFTPFETLSFGQPPGVQVTRESLAFMAGMECRPPGAEAFLTSIGAKTNVTE